MNNIFEILTITALVLFFSLILFYFAMGSFSLTKLNINSYLFYKDIILMTLIGVVLVVTQFDLIFGVRFWAITGDVSDESRNLGWYAILYFLIAYPIGMMASNLIFNQSIKSNQFERYLTKTVLNPYQLSNTSLLLSLSFFLLVSMVSLLYVYISMESVPIIELIKGASFSDIQVSRTNAKLYFSGSPFIKDMIALKLPILVSYALYVIIKTDKSKLSNILFIVSFTTSILALTYNFEKAPVVLYILGFFLISVVINNGIKLKTLLVFGGLSLLFMMLLFIFLIGHSDFSQALEKLGGRLLIAQTSAIFLSFDYFPDKHEFLGGLSISGVLAKVFGVEYLRYGRVLFEIYDYPSVLNGEAGLIVGNFISEAWALWGIGGVILSPLWVGFFVASISNLIFRLPKNALFIALYAQIGSMLSLNGGMAVFVNIISFLIPVFYIASILLFGFFIQKLLFRKESSFC
ncbi:hypothetical protein [Vibrio crassostreae]|uniref:hypothetical protein n=1 Tax=Vibrio crassostreae TaxID=246167 RepID=UPI002E18EC43|nr:hypothetical protein [Vibrio crassostreae]